jgi:hypothetical protein
MAGRGLNLSCALLLACAGTAVAVARGTADAPAAGAPRARRQPVEDVPTAAGAAPARRLMQDATTQAVPPLAGAGAGGAAAAGPGAGAAAPKPAGAASAGKPAAADTAASLLAAAAAGPGPGGAPQGTPVLGQAGPMKPGSPSTAQPPIGLHGSGTTNAAVLLWRVVEELFVRARPAIRITYRAIGSVTGQKVRRRRTPHHGGGVPRPSAPHCAASPPQPNAQPAEPRDRGRARARRAAPPPIVRWRHTPPPPPPRGGFRGLWRRWPFGPRRPIARPRRQAPYSPAAPHNSHPRSS